MRSPAIDFTGYRQISLTVPITRIESPAASDAARCQLARTIRTHVLHFVRAVGTKGALKRAALRGRGGRERFGALLALVLDGGQRLEQYGVLLFALSPGEQRSARLCIALIRRQRLINAGGAVFEAREDHHYFAARFAFEQRCDHFIWRKVFLWHCGLLISAPDFAGYFDDQAQLRFFIFDRQRVAADGAGETALRRDAEILERHESRGLVDAPLDGVFVFQRGRLRADEPETHELVFGHQTQR